MVGHDMNAAAATGGMMLKGNASITARVSPSVLADPDIDQRADVVDVSLTNIITADGTPVDRDENSLSWMNLDLTYGNGARFAKGSEINGAFYDNGNEVVGEFNKNKIIGAFGALEAPMDMMMDDTMDMASQ